MRCHATLMHQAMSDAALGLATTALGRGKKASKTVGFIPDETARTSVVGVRNDNLRVTVSLRRRLGIPRQRQPGIRIQGRFPCRGRGTTTPTIIQCLTLPLLRICIAALGRGLECGSGLSQAVRGNRGVRVHAGKLQLSHGGTGPWQLKSMPVPSMRVQYAETQQVITNTTRRCRRLSLRGIPMFFASR